MKVVFAVLLGVIMVTGCDSGGNAPVEPSQPTNPPGTGSLSKSESRSQNHKSKLTDHDASQN
jgi:hypothetical protein